MDWSLPWWFSGKEPAYQCRRSGLDPWAWKIPWRRKWQPTPVFLAGKPHGQMNLADYKSWDRRVRHDLTTKHLGLDLGTEKKTLMEKLRKLI